MEDAVIQSVKVPETKDHQKTASVEPGCFLKLVENIIL
jgi:hypothetical protein